MLFNFERMNEKYANIIVSKDTNGNYDCYNINHEPEDIDDLLDKEGYEFFVSLINQEISGYIECYFEDEILEVGLALLPGYVNEGLGTDFVSQAIEYLIDYYDYVGEVIRSYINVDDIRAIDVLERVGFNKVDTTKKWVELEIYI
jgi:RimJ/RimL family protein N-acetyltransferase